MNARALQTGKKGGLLESETLEVIDEYLGMPELHFLEGCNDCEACATACPFYMGIDKNYSPAKMADEMRKLYKATSTISGKILGRLVGASLPQTREEVMKIYDLAYHCSNCGWCYYTCPHGIDSGVLINMLRSVLFRAGLAPQILNILARLESMLIERPADHIMKQWNEVVSSLREKHKTAEPGEAEYLILLDIYSAFVDRESTDLYLTILDEIGVKYALPDRPLGIRPPLALTLGHYESARKVAEFVYTYTLSRRARTLIVLDGGYPYNDLKFAFTYYKARKPAGLEVVHIANLIYDYYSEEGIPPFLKWGRATYIPSCNIDTRGGVAAGAKLVEATAKPYDKHLMWPYAGAGWLSLLCPYVREKLGEVLGVDIVTNVSEFEKTIIDHIKRVGAYLARQAVETSPGRHVFSCLDDIIVVRDSGVDGVNPVHLAKWLVDHLA